MSFKFKPNKHQREFLMDVDSYLLHLSTGFGGGKTFALCIKALQLSRANKNMHGGLVVPSFPDFKKDVLPEFEQILEKFKIKYQYHKTEHWFKFPWSNGKLYVVSAEKSLRGPNWAYAVINEVTLIPLVRYKEVLGRCRIKRAKILQIASVGTPEGFVSEYYDYFIENPPANLKVMYGNTTDNTDNLNEAYLDLLNDAYDTKMQEAYIKGLWVNMAGNLFYYSYNPSVNDDETLDAKMFSEYHISLDFNVDPFCATVWGYDGFRVYGVDEIKLEGGDGYDTRKMIQALQKKGYTPMNSFIYPDAAGNARSTKGKPDNVVLKEAGYRVRVKSAAPRFRTRQLNVNNLLDKRRILINPKKCKGIKKDFQGVEQDIVTLEKSKENPKLTHFSDGLDYMCDILFPFSGEHRPSGEQRIR
jgi:hypothetical protein